MPCECCAAPHSHAPAALFRATLLVAPPPHPSPLPLHPPLPPARPDPRSNQLEKIPDDIISDPSLQRETAVSCPKCAERGAVFIQAKATPADDRMKLIFVCTSPACVYKWQS